MLPHRVDDATKLILGRELWTAPTKLPPGSFVLDLGGGPGLFGAQLKTQNNHIISMDIKRDLLYIRPNVIQEGIEPVQGNALYLPFKNNSFDIILARAVLHHFPDHLDTAFKELHRILKSNGTILIEEPGHYNPLACIIRKTISTTSHESGEEPLIPSHLVKKTKTYFQVKEISYYYLLSYGLPNLAGLVSERFKGLIRKIARAVVRIDRRLLNHKFFQPFCGYVLIVAKKNY